MKPPTPPSRPQLGERGTNALNRGSDREAVHFGHRGTPPRFSAVERHAARRLFTKDVFRGESEFRNVPSRPPTQGQQPVTDRQNVKSDRSRT
jgi:hypothetical protein